MAAGTGSTEIGLPPVPKIRRSSAFGGLAITGPCPTCLFIVTLDFKAKRKKLGSKKVYIRQYHGTCPSHGEFVYGWMDLSRAWQKVSENEDIRKLSQRIQ